MPSCKTVRTFPIFVACVLAWTGTLQAQPNSAAELRAEPISYAEQHRPRFHFSPPSMWMNDPNGMVYFDGEYHLFYQYYPEDTVWGPMHWGHAISTDLVYWQNMPVALYPDEKGYIFSGSAVFDENNTSGFGSEATPPLVALFTYHSPELAKLGGRNHEYQGLAWSTDRGRTWTKFEGNPVLPNTQKLQDFRDPKVFWHEPSAEWVMALSATDHVQFWASPDLKEWSKLSEFGREWGAHGGVWECPDLIEMTVEGTAETRWVLILNLNPGGPQGGSGTQYFVGDFDGRNFTLEDSFKQILIEQEAAWLDSGKDNYAGVTWSNVPESDGRHLFIGWMSNWEYAQQVPTSPWRSAMTLPRELVLRKSGGRYHVASRPVAELKKLRGRSWRTGPTTVMEGEPLLLNSGVPASGSEWIIEFDSPATDEFTVSVNIGNAHGEIYSVGFDGGENAYFSDRRFAGDHSFSESFTGIHYSPRISGDSRLRMHLFFDVASAELFADDGDTVMTDTFFPTTGFYNAWISVNGSDIDLLGVEVHELNGIWTAPPKPDQRLRPVGGGGTTIPSRSAR